MCNFLNELFSLEGKVAFISGSSRGLGRGYAKALAAAGATVIINGRDAAGVTIAVQQLLEQGFKADSSVFDLTDRQAAAVETARLLELYGAVDILVNNAGMQQRGQLENLEFEHWQGVIDLNLTAPFVLTQLLVKKMIERRSGKIINIGSLMSSITRPTTAPYTASKGAIVALTKSMAVEWGKYNIQANAIAPGYFHTEMTEKLVSDPEFNAWIVGRTPMKRWGQTDDLSGLMVFLASAASDYLTGQCIYVDGGLSSAI